jgi:hypothetical protein
MQRHYDSVKNSLWETDALKRTIQDIFDYPLREMAREIINRRLKLGSTTDEELATLCIQLRDEGRLCVVEQKNQDDIKTPQIICSMGVRTI